MKNKSAVLETVNLEFLDLISYPDLTITEGELTFVVGESGSGKSTLLKLFNYTYTPTRGEIFYRGESTVQLDTVELRRKVLLVSQSVFLFDGSIRENFDLFYDFREEAHLSDQTKKHFMDLAKVPFGLSDPCQNMSGGERQRVYLAICLSFQPDVLMMDEPTSALDQLTAHDLFDQLKAHAREEGMTLVVISHDQTLMEKYADHVISVQREVDYAGNR